MCDVGIHEEHMFRTQASYGSSVHVEPLVVRRNRRRLCLTGHLLLELVHRLPAAIQISGMHRVFGADSQIAIEILSQFNFAFGCVLLLSLLRYSTSVSRPGPWFLTLYTDTDAFER